MKYDEVIQDQIHKRIVERVNTDHHSSHRQTVFQILKISLKNIFVSVTHHIDTSVLDFNTNKYHHHSLTHSKYAGIENISKDNIENKRLYKHKMRRNFCVGRALPT